MEELLVSLSTCNALNTASRRGDSLMSIVISCVVSRANFINFELSSMSGYSNE